MPSNSYGETYFKRQYNVANSKEPQLPIDFSVLMKFLSPGPEGKVLDFGCGLGRISYEISKTGCSVVGIDKSKFAIEFAVSHFGNNNTKFICSDALDTDFKDFFHYALCYHMLEHLEKMDAIKILSKVNKALKENGVVVIGVPIEESSIIRRAIRLFVAGSSVRDPTHLRSLSIAETLSDLLKSGFEVTDVYTFSYHPVIRSLDKIIPFIGTKITTNAIIRGIKKGRK